MTIAQRVEALRAKMRKRGLEAYIIPTSDPHQSEYVSDHYKTRQFISGFTGSAGTAVVTLHECGLWTDGRYFLQAEKELANTPFKLYRMGTADATVEDFLRERVSAFGKVGFDGRCMSVAKYKELAKKLGRRMLISDVDYISEIWTDRPALPTQMAYWYETAFAGRSVEEKLSILRFMMRERELDYTFLGALEDICYLYNIRGWDIACTPVVMSYALISHQKAMLFVDQNKLDDEVRTPLTQAGVEICDYEQIDEALASIEGQKIVYLDPERTNISLYKQMNDNVKIQQGVNLTTLMKAIKDDTEIEQTKEAFLKDGVALVKFFNWVETGASTGAVNERAACEKLHAFRAEQTDFLDDSFSAIIGYAANAAIVHYDPMKNERPARIHDRGLLLVDSGGHYLQGTTDITRTVALGETTYEEKLDYTLVLKAHIAGMAVRFPEGTTGSAIDAVVRAPLNREFRDFNHGTGHGVGHVLGVHEGPQSFSRKDRGVEIAPGMITSMEPGLYVRDKHGIRIESITLCVVAEENEFGRFLALESLTWVPIDTRPVLREKLDAWELEWLNNYNKTCFEKLSSRLTGEEFHYLEERCRPLE
ncbi:MAG: aminopeptidase P family protein [Ndongobacter sp.]|nr:aminopeptidase P family protein [Ndongobacter sp.]